MRYFASLVPELGTDPKRFGDLMRRQAFTVAEATDQVLVDKIKQAIAQRLEQGNAASGIEAIQFLLNSAGVTPKNPGYAENVFRTNMMDAFTQGDEEERQDPDVKDTFPVWRYDGIGDVRERETHRVQNGKYFSNDVSFAEVRDSEKGDFDGFQCRCVPTGIDKWTWAKLQEDGADVEKFAERFGGPGSGRRPGSGLLSRAKELPRQILEKAVSKAKEKYGQLEARYGRKYALAIMGAGIAGVPVPVPGASLLMAAPVIGAAELHRRLSLGHFDEPANGQVVLTPATIQALGKRFIQELQAEKFGGPGSGPHPGSVKASLEDKLVGLSKIQDPGMKKSAIEQIVREHPHMGDVFGIEAPTEETKNPDTATVGHLTDAFDKVDKGHNFVHLGDLREALPNASKEHFEKLLDQAQREGKLTLSAAEGRHGVNERDKKSAVYAKDPLHPDRPRMMLYVSRKNAHAEEFCGGKGGKPGPCPLNKPEEKTEKQSRIPEEEPSETAKRSKAAHVMVDKDVQRYAEEHNEAHLAKALGGVSLPDSEAMDVAIAGNPADKSKWEKEAARWQADKAAGKNPPKKMDISGEMTHAVEMKTSVISKNRQIDMNPYAQVRKIVAEKERGAVLHTVVYDDHDVYNAKGPGQHDESKRRIFYRRGVGGSKFPIDGMHEVKDAGELKTLMNMPDKQLPAKAQRTDARLRVGTWKPFQDEQGKGFKNKKTGTIVRAKK